MAHHDRLKSIVRLVLEIKIWNNPHIHPSNKRMILENSFDLIQTFRIKDGSVALFTNFSLRETVIKYVLNNPIHYFLSSF